MLRLVKQCDIKGIRAVFVFGSLRRGLSGMPSRHTLCGEQLCTVVPESAWIPVDLLITSCVFRRRTTGYKDLGGAHLKFYSSHQSIIGDHELHVLEQITIKEPISIPPRDVERCGRQQENHCMPLVQR